MSTTRRQQANAILKMIDAWVEYGRAHLENVPADAPTCAALPSIEWGQAGYRLLALATDSDLTDDPEFKREAARPMAQMLILMVNTGLLASGDLDPSYS